MPMIQRSMLVRAFALVVLALFARAAAADEVKVMNSGGFSSAYKALQPKFEAASGHTLATAWGPSMGASPEAIPNRLARGESADVVIMVGYALDELIKKGIVIADSKVDLADSRIGVAVKSGTPKPDIATVDGLRSALLQAKSIAYSDSASGVYVERELFRKLGIEDQAKAKATKIERTPVAEMVASGRYEIGFQQVSELLPVPGIDYIGPLPAEIQQLTTFAAGIATGAREPDAARALVTYLTAPAAAPIIRQSGMEPA